MINFIKDFFKPIYYHIIKIGRNIKWRKQNKHNFTNVRSIFPLNRVSVGNFTYGDLYVHYYRTENERLEIGHFCSIGPNVQFFLGGEHNYKIMTTYPVRARLNHECEAISNGPIIIEDDVWIGANAIILSGVKIEQGAVIGAGSIVARDIPAYSIFIGNKVVKKRFCDELCLKLKQINFSKIDRSSVLLHIAEIYDIDELLVSEWFEQLIDNEQISHGDE